jgi:hypothetical protein
MDEWRNEWMNESMEAQTSFVWKYRTTENNKQGEAHITSWTNNIGPCITLHSTKYIRFVRWWWETKPGGRRPHKFELMFSVKDIEKGIFREQVPTHMYLCMCVTVHMG